MLRRFPAAFALISLILAAPPQAAAQEAPPVPERRLIFERDVDFFGDDLRAIFDTTVEACQAACLADANCGAFTFNARSGACFPKRGIDRRDAYAGAISAAVVPMPVDIRTLADRRAAALSGLQEVDLGAVRTEAEAIGPRYPRGTLPIEDLRAAAWDATDAADWARALRIWGEVVARTDDGEAWARYAEAARLFQSGDRLQQSRIRARAAPAALNGYLRSLDDRGAADALTTAAWALTDQGRGRASIPLLRLAVEVDPGSERESLLAEAIDRYGFRTAESRADSESAVPRLCVSFTEDLAAGTDYAPYVRLPGVSFAAEAEGRQLCLEGVRHGTRYALTIRAGLPAENGDVLQRDANLSLYVRDRSPDLRFPGRAYVLPQGPQTALPVVTVNAEQVDLTLYRVPERNLRSLIEEGSFGRPLDRWSVERFGELQGEEVWNGSADIPHNLDTALNTDVTTRLPLAEALEGQAPGLYALQAALPGVEGRDALPATQWFLTSDIGLATLQGSDGLHVFARSLGSAGALEGLTVRLVSRANRVLGEAETDVEGHARFDPGLARGTGAGAPALVTVEAEGDFAFLPLTDPAFDLSDRGVEGRAAPGPIDLFLSTERGAYRAGDRIHATMIARDGTMQPLGGLPLTAVLMRPDGVEHSRQTVTADAGGGAALSLPTSGAVPRGTWRLAVYADPDADALAETSLLIEDFLPERIDAELSLPDGPLGPNDTTTLTVAARYLFGAPGAGLDVEGEVRVRNVRTLDAAPGFVFGRHDGATQPVVEPLSRVETDASGRAAMPLRFPDAEDPSGPLEAEVRVRVSEGSGRPIEREITRALTPEAPLIGVRPKFHGAVPEGAEAGFDVIAVGPDDASVAAQVDWTLERVETRYQWYSAFGEWNWEPVTRRTRVASGTETTGPAPVTVAAGVEWGRYELILERADGPYTATSVGFDAGWYAPADAAAAPDQLEVALDRAAYRPGDTALLRVEAQSAGAVLVTVLSDRLIDMQTVEVPAGASEISLMVTDAWGAGAYVAATLVRPLDGATGRAPVRALGLAHAAVDPGPLRLAAAFEGPGQATPRETMDVALRVEGLAPGEQGWATIAAVDQGILNLTGFEAPDAPEHFFGQRRLGVELRDLYGRLIDGRTGALGRVRSGGDRGTMMRMEAPPPTEDLVAYFSGPVAVGSDGLARTSFDLPAFNGTVRLMGVVWGESGAVGMAEREVLVRDPVVVTASLPLFLAPNDESTLRLDLAHVDGAAGEMALSIEGGRVALGSAPTSVTLSEGEQRALVIPVTAGPMPGISNLTVGLTTPDGEVLTKELTLRVEDNDPSVARVSRFALDPGATFTLSRDVFTGLRPGTGSATLALGPLARLNAPGLLATLDAYPYGCTEQVTSRALPLLYLADVAEALGLAVADGLEHRIDDAIGRVLANQSSSGGFGLWSPGSGDLWLDAYVTDFLSRARAAGHTVPDLTFASALDQLANQVAVAPDFEPGVNGGGAGLAYALHVLAREGRARIGDLRYYADVKGADFGTPLAAAQLGAALAAYGEPSRADAMFRQAEAQVGVDIDGWRDDYGSSLRDAASLLTLASEAGSDAVDREALVTEIARAGGARLSTQEAAWSLLATRALVEDGAAVTIDGVPADGPLVRLLEDEIGAEPMAFTNAGDRALELTLTSIGTPELPEPPGGTAFAIDRVYYTLEGELADPVRLRQGDRLVSVLTVTPFGPADGRLMVDDALPAGLEIDNPSLLRSGDISALGWLDTVEPRHAEFLDARFRAAVDWRSDAPFRLAYIVRAVSPGSYRHPAPLVEDMYRPARRAVGAGGRVRVLE